MAVIVAIAILLLLYLLTIRNNKKEQKLINSKKEIKSKYDKEVENLLYENAEESYFIYSKQYEDTLNIIKTSTVIRTVLSRLKFLNYLLDYIEDTARKSPEYNYLPLIDSIKNTIADKREYLNLTILRMVSKADVETVGLTPAKKRNKYKTIYRQCENVKNQLSEENIKTYTDLILQRLDIDLLSLPEHALLLTRLNCSRKDDAIPPEYYSGEYPTFTAAVSALIKDGYLTITDDKSRYILTDSGLKQTGWL